MDKVSIRYSSYLVSPPAMAAVFVLGVLAAFFGQRKLAALLLFLFLLAAAARVWARAAGRKVSFRVTGTARGVFPGETLDIRMEVRNEKLLPVTWMELFCPLQARLCLTPEVCREPDPWEVPELKEIHASTEHVGEMRFPPLLWYETTELTSRWTANRRGVYSMEAWRLRTGDGIGMAQVETALPREDVCRFAVYPALIPVSPDLFLRSLWNADTGSRGVLEDPTVIRSTRDYQVGDSLKQINWRLTARGLPLAVNVYEEIMPKSVHFLLDGESFSGPDKHLDELEDALSILASEFVKLAEHQVQCGLSICRGGTGQAVNLFRVPTVAELLQALAAYEVLPDQWDAERQHILPQTAQFDALPICEAAQSAGRFYYIAYDTETLPRQELLHRLDQSVVSVLTYRESRPYGDYETVCLQRLKEANAHG